MPMANSMDSESGSAAMAPAARKRGGTRRALLDRLKRAGPLEAQDLAVHLGVTAMAVRQHLYAFEAEGIVAATPIQPGLY